MFGVKGSVELRADDVQEGELPSLRGGTTTPGVSCNVCKVNPMFARARGPAHKCRIRDPVCKRTCEQSSIHAHLQRVQGEPNVARARGPAHKCRIR